MQLFVLDSLTLNQEVWLRGFDPTDTNALAHVRIKASHPVQSVMHIVSLI
jgi:hypothetical protein